MARKKLASRGQQQNKRAFMQGLENQVLSVLAEAGEPTVAYAYYRFKLMQDAKGNSLQTIAFYDRWYKKYAAFLESGEDGVTVNTMAAKYFGDSFEQNAFITFLGDVNRQTINAYMRAYRAFGNYCLEQGLLDGFSCPIKELEPPAKQVYTTTELNKLTKKPSIDNFEEYRNFIIISLILATGARANTIINLAICDVELEDGYITFNTTKAHKVVRVGLEKKIRKDLKEYIARWRLIDGDGEPIDKTDYLFCNTYGEQLTRSGLSKAIVKYNRARGVEKTSIHLFRHTFAKNWITSGGDIISLAKVLTHTELDMVKRYSNLYGEDVKKEIEQHSTLSQLRQRSGSTLKTRGNADIITK